MSIRKSSSPTITDFRTDSIRLREILGHTVGLVHSSSVAAQGQVLVDQDTLITLAVELEAYLECSLDDLNQPKEVWAAAKREGL